MSRLVGCCFHLPSNPLSAVPFSVGGGAADPRTYHPTDGGVEGLTPPPIRLASRVSTPPDSRRPIPFRYGLGFRIEEGSQLIRD